MKKLFIISFLFLSFTTIYGQDSDTTLLRKLVEKQVLSQKEADEIMQKNKAKPQTISVAAAPSSETSVIPQKVRDAFNTPYMNFSGYGLLLYKYNDVAKIKHDLNPRVVFLNMSGKLNNNIGYSLMAEFVNPMIYEFYGTWSPSSAFNLKLGQMKVPFTLENPISLTQLETVYNTRTISSLVGMADDVWKLQNGKNNTGRDAGFTISGSLFKKNDFNLLEYNMGVFQGTGITTAEKDNNKDFAAQVMLQPIKGFRIGGGTYFGAATYALSSSAPVASHVRNRWALSTEYKSDRLYARSEWLHGNDGGIDKEGLYGTLVYYVLPKKVNILGKVDYFNKNKDANQEVMDYTLGANYYFYKQCRIQLNYTYSDYSKQWGAENSNSIQAQFQVVF